VSFKDGSSTLGDTSSATHDSTGAFRAAGFWVAGFWAAGFAAAGLDAGAVGAAV
jgi:hypothetical protein